MNYQKESISPHKDLEVTMLHSIREKFTDQNDGGKTRLYSENMSISTSNLFLHVVLNASLLNTIFIYHHGGVSFLFIETYKPLFII